MDEIDCWFCGNEIEFDGSSYFEGKEGETYSLTRCPHCETPNRIYWQTSMEWYSSEPTPKDCQDNDIEESLNRKGGHMMEDCKHLRGRWCTHPNLDWQERCDWMILEQSNCRWYAKMEI